MANFLASETAKTAVIIAGILLIPVGVFMYANNSNSNSRVESEQDQIADVDNSDTDLTKDANDMIDTDNSLEVGGNADSEKNDINEFPNTSSKFNVLVGYGDTKESLIKETCGSDSLAINMAINSFQVIPGRFVDIECN